MQDKLVALALMAASVVFTALFVAPRFVDGFLMEGAPLCSSVTAGDDCIEEVTAVVTEREHGIRKDFGPIRWHLDLPDGEEVILRTPYLVGEGFPVGLEATLQLWDGDPIAIREGTEQHTSLAWGVNRWICWALAALAMMLAGLTLLYHSLQPDPDDDSEPVDGRTAAAGVGLLSAIAVLPVWTAINAFGWPAVLVVVAVWASLATPVMVRGHRRKRRSAKAKRSPGLG